MIRILFKNKYLEKFHPFQFEVKQTRSSNKVLKQQISSLNILHEFVNIVLNVSNPKLRIRRINSLLRGNGNNFIELLFVILFLFKLLLGIFFGLMFLLLLSGLNSHNFVRFILFRLFLFRLELRLRTMG